MSNISAVCTFLVVFIKRIVLIMDSWGDGGTTREPLTNVTSRSDFRVSQVTSGTGAGISSIRTPRWAFADNTNGMSLIPRLMNDTVPAIKFGTIPSVAHANLDASHGMRCFTAAVLSLKTLPLIPHKKSYFVDVERLSPSPKQTLSGSLVISVSWPSPARYWQWVSQWASW